MIHPSQSMLRYFSNLAIAQSTLFGCLLLGSLFPLQSTAAPPLLLPTIDQSFNSTDVKTTSDQRQKLVHFTTENGNLMQRNGKPAYYSIEQPAQEISYPELLSATIQQAKEWGYRGQLSPNNLLIEKTTWSRGCENSPTPFACDPVVREGWKITIPGQRERWILRGERADDLQLIERSNWIEKRLPIRVRDEIKRVAANQLQLSPSVVLITNVEFQTFSDGCLGLGDLTESCIQQITKGYRVTVTGKPKEQQIYRISNDTSSLRTEAIAGLPTRTDELPTTIARKIFTVAQSDLKQSIENLKITEVEKTFQCFRSPTASPTEPCSPIKKINGWKMTITNYQQSITYTVDLNGTILSKQ
ncbi:MAG: hypothetical protein KME18_19360 [Phormidium tanganyikae FI6-MK23]|nr:hypothetical protein [Phormidium tanganyikae FI6-MK23]